jgi:alkylhydroperoxidase family enzyme
LLLADMATVARIGCPWCLDFRYWVMHTHGISHEEDRGRAHLARELAVRSPEAAGLGIRRAGDRDAADVDDELVRRLQEHLDEAQLIELTMIVCLENVRSRFTSALGIAPHRFKDRCEMPQLEELEGG